MQAFEITDLQKEQAQAGKRYLEFLRAEALSMGLYHLAAGEDDPQQPHQEDEVYYVASGEGRIRVGDEEDQVGPGSIVYVPARVPHKFHSIIEDLSILVFFAPAESN
jgi:mannose-6-phosphate isomerase-like protein (cupin superfamily)